MPVARLAGLTSAATLHRLVADGVIGRPASATRPTATGQERPRPRRAVSEIVGEQRR
jgi:hypothetical protein